MNYIIDEVVINAAKDRNKLIDTWLFSFIKDKDQINKFKFTSQMIDKDTEVIRLYKKNSRNTTKEIVKLTISITF